MIGATSVALNLGDSARAHLITHQMSHSANTETQYYHGIVGDQHVASVFGTMTALRSGASCNQAGAMTALRSGTSCNQSTAAASSSGWSGEELEGLSTIYR